MSRRRLLYCGACRTPFVQTQENIWEQACDCSRDLDVETLEVTAGSSEGLDLSGVPARDLINFLAGAR